MRKLLLLALLVGGCAGSQAAPRGTDVARLEPEGRICEYVPPKNIERRCRNQNLTLARE
jgi:hypothetical protein